MEFLDDDARPRLVFQARAPPSACCDQREVNKALAALSVGASSALIALSFLYLHSDPFQSIALWFSFSLLLGPFAPISLTAGDVRVGQGPILHFPLHDHDHDSTKKHRSNHKRPKPRPSEDSLNGSVAGNGCEEERGIWTEEDIALLRRQLVKHPAGKARRWEMVAEAFRGRHKAESVVKMAKDVGEEKKEDGDLLCWTNGEDIALLNALKAFPKEAPMRWDKIAAAVPGKTKPACVRRVSELKKGFRSSKAGNE